MPTALIGVCRCMWLPSGCPDRLMTPPKATMRKTATVTKLITDIYDAAIDRKPLARHPGAGARAYRRSSPSPLIAVDRKNSARFSAAANAPSEGELAYIRKYCAMDPRMKMPSRKRSASGSIATAPGRRLVAQRSLLPGNAADPTRLPIRGGNKIHEDDNVMVAPALHQGWASPSEPRADQRAPTRWCRTCSARSASRCRTSSSRCRRWSASKSSTGCAIRCSLLSDEVPHRPHESRRAGRDQPAGRRELRVVDSQLSPLPTASGPG